MKYFFTLAILMSTLAFSFQVSAQLPKEVQADLLQKKIIAAIEQKDFDIAANLIDDYRALDISMPPAISMIDVKISKNNGNINRQKTALEEYFNNADQSHSAYEAALEMQLEIDDIINRKSNAESRIKDTFSPIQKIFNIEYKKEPAARSFGRFNGKYKGKTWATFLISQKVLSNSKEACSTGFLKLTTEAFYAPPAVRTPRSIVSGSYPKKIREIPLHQISNITPIVKEVSYRKKLEGNIEDKWTPNIITMNEKFIHSNLGVFLQSNSKQKDVRSYMNSFISSCNKYMPQLNSNYKIISSVEQADKPTALIANDKQFDSYGKTNSLKTINHTSEVSDYAASPTNGVLLENAIGRIQLVNTDFGFITAQGEGLEIGDIVRTQSPDGFLVKLTVVKKSSNGSYSLTPMDGASISALQPGSPITR